MYRTTVNTKIHMPKEMHRHSTNTYSETSLVLHCISSAAGIQVKTPVIN